VAAAAPASAVQREESSKTGARKVAVPAPEVSAAPADDPAATRSGYTSSPAPADAPKRTSAPAPSVSAPKAVPAPVAAAEKTQQTRPKKRDTPVWTYVGIGVTVGLAVIGFIELFVH
jgi:cobalamin biosynthesis Mg chelatase CobN